MPNAIIVGAGLAGLTAARQLHRASWEVTILEARTSVGGRIQTDCVDGFLLDHGFQVYLTGYATAGRELDLDKLQLGSFCAGAFVQLGGTRHRVCDPLRSAWYNMPLHAFQTLLSPVGSIADKLRIASFRNRVCRTLPSEFLRNQNATAKERLEQMGFSPVIIDRFFRPFFGGIFLDDSLGMSAGIMEFVFRTFSMGHAALPAKGMQAIPNQIANGLPNTSIVLNTTVDNIQDGRVTLSDGQVVRADHVIVATEEPTAKRLLSNADRTTDKKEMPLQAASTCCLYFDVLDPPIQEATLLLNGQGDGVINNLCFPSFAQPKYAPSGRSLLSVSTIGHAEQAGTDLLAEVRRQLVDWFGQSADAWRHLRTYLIPYALPNQSPRSLVSSETQSRISDRVWRCGDYCETSSIEGAIQSGLRTAKEVEASTLEKE